VTAAGARRVAGGLTDSDAIVYELAPMREYVFDARTGTTESIPLPLFDADVYSTGVVSLAVSRVSGFNVDSAVRVFMQNAVQSADDPSVIFASSELFLSITSSSQRSLETAPWLLVGPGARLLIAWEQGASAATARTTFAVFVTLRRRWLAGPS
jgi:hypothetical protein